MPDPNQFEAERQALMGYFQAIFLADPQPNPAPDPLQPFLPIVSMPNRKQPQPDEGAFVNVSVQNGVPFNRAAGSTATRAVGMFTVEVFMPEGTGTKPSRDVAGLLEANYHNFSLDTPAGRIRFFEVTCRDVPSGVDGYGKTNVEVVFWSDKNASGVANPAFGDPATADRGYVLIPPGNPAVPPTKLGLTVASNAALDQNGNIVLRNTTTGAFSYLSMQGAPGAEVIVALDAYTGAQVNISTDASNNLLLYNETTALYLYPFIRDDVVVASAEWTLPGVNWNRDSSGNLLLRNVTTNTFQRVSFQGPAGQQTIQPVDAP